MSCLPICKLLNNIAYFQVFGFPNMPMTRSQALAQSKTKFLHLLPQRGSGDSQKLCRLADLAPGSLQCSRDLRPLGRISHLGKGS